MRERIKDKIDWEEWLVMPGLPPVMLNFTTGSENSARKLARDFIKGGGAAAPPDAASYKNFTSAQKGIFLQELMNNLNTGLNAKVVDVLQKSLNISSEINAKLTYLW